MRHASSRIPAPLLRTTISALALGVLLVAVLRAEELELTLDAAATKVTFRLPATGHDVEGLAHLTGGVVRFDPASGTASGDLTVDATTTETGNGSRDDTMREDVLEVAKFPSIVFRAELVEGAVALEGSSEVTLHGSFDIHGTRHPLALPAKLEVHDGEVSGATRFPVPYQQWGMHDPSILFLRVAPVVEVNVELHGRLAPVAATAPAGGR